MNRLLTIKEVEQDIEKYAKINTKDCPEHYEKIVKLMKAWLLGKGSKNGKRKPTSKKR